MVSEKLNRGEEDKALDRLHPEVVTAVSYLKEMRQELLKNWNPDKSKYPPFGDLEFILDIVYCLNPDLVYDVKL